MTIAELREKSKILAGRAPKDALILSILVFACTLSFGFGYLAGLDAARPGDVRLDITAAEAQMTEGAVVASKSGTKYYLPSCTGVDRISGDNKVWFRSATDAAAAGYSPAANCDGL
jgi:hypothetical protein